jgi:hypothetical protein
MFSLRPNVRPSSRTTQPSASPTQDAPDSRNASSPVSASYFQRSHVPRTPPNSNPTVGRQTTRSNEGSIAEVVHELPLRGSSHTSRAKRSLQILLAVALGTGRLLAGAPAAHGALGDTTTVTGSTFGFVDGTGLGIPNTTRFFSPRDMALDTAGNLYVADTSNHRIRKVNLSTGQTTTIAGNGTAGYVDGTGGPTGSTQFNVPSGVAVDTNGIVYVGDRDNNRIRKIAIDGTTTTLAGNGMPGYVDGTGGPNGSTEFNGPIGVAVDANGNVYVGDSQNNRIRKIAVDGTTTTLAGGTGPRSADDNGTGGPAGTERFTSPTLPTIESAKLLPTEPPQHSPVTEPLDL